ncbi:hypothetical protein O0L34_g17175 [Tuta absoluta]|nr:hypothetical protein O0L34_g17175 [Tuta absoluta]
MVTSLALLMHWKETGGVEKLFTLPARPIPSRVLSKVSTAHVRHGDLARPAHALEGDSRVLSKKYQRNMTLRNEAEEGDEDKQREPEPARRATRKRRHDENIPPPETPAPPSVAELEPPTPVPQDYEPSVERAASPCDARSPASPAYPPPLTPRLDDDAPSTPGMLSSLGPPLTPGTLGPLTPGTLLQGGITPGGLQHGGMTPAGLQHGDAPDLGGMTPAGLHHGGMVPGGMTPGLGLDGGMTPAGLVHGGLTPAGLHHGGMTPGGLDHGGMTPGGLGHGGMTPAGLAHGGLTPAGLTHGGMTPAGLAHGGMTPAGLAHGGMTPVGLQHGGMTPGGLAHGAMLSHSMERMPMMPQVGSDRADDQMLSPLLHADYQSGMQNMQMTNLGYDDQHGHQSPQHDYDLPLSNEQAEEGEREAGETDEQFEERVLNRRAAQLFAVLRPKLVSRAQLGFAELAPRHNNRKQVAQKFYSLLVLKKHQVLKLQQEETYGPIIISKGAQFETEAI